MNSLEQIQAAVAALPQSQQKELAERLTAKLASGEHRRLPLVPATGRRITQKEIDDVLDSD